MANPGPATTQTANYLLNGNASDGIALGQAGGEMGFYGVTPIFQPTASANTTTVAAGSTTAVYTNTTFSGGSGSTAYTVGDIVAALKALGLIKA